MMNILFVSKNIQVEANLYNSKTSEEIYKALPLKGKVNWWEEEIYFYVSLKLKPESLTENVEIGDIAYWPEGPCICIFLGRTPISTDERPKPASGVTIIGKVQPKDYSLLKEIRSGSILEMRKI